MLVAICRSVTDKVAREDNEGWERLATDFKNEDLDQPALCQEIDQGHAFTTHHKGRRKGANFKGAGYIALDFDNVGSQSEAKQIMSHPTIREYYAIFYHTPSATPDNPRFRVIFELEQPVYDGDYYRDLAIAFIWKTGAVADKSCKDPCRLFFGSKGSAPRHTGRTLPMSVVAEIVKEWRDYSKELERSSRAEEAARFQQNGTGKNRYLQAVVETQLANVTGSPKGDRHDATRAAARVLGGYVAGEGLSENDVYNRLMNAITGPDVDYKERKQVIEWGLAEGKREPLYIPPLEFGRNGTAALKPSPAPEPVPTPIKEQLEQNPWLDYKVHPGKLIAANRLSELPPLEWLFEGEIQKKSICCFYGPSGGGKSFLALDYSLRLAQEEAVVYLAAEGVAGYEQRIESWCEHNKTGRGNLYFYASPLNLMSFTETLAFIALIAPLKPALVVIDTLAWCMSGFGGDENATKDMMTFMVNCRLIVMSLGCTVIIVHHTGKSTGTERGNSSLRGGAETLIEVMPDDDTVKVSCDKQKDGVEFEAKHFKRMQLLESCVLVPMLRPDELTEGGKPTKRQLDILEKLNLETFETGAKAVQLKEMLEIGGKGMTALYTNLSSLKRHGLITQGAKGDPFFITSAGKQALKAYRPLAG